MHGMSGKDRSVDPSKASKEPGRDQATHAERTRTTFNEVNGGGMLADWGSLGEAVDNFRK